MEKRFPLGFWNYENADTQTAATVADWDEAGMTVTMSPNYAAGVNDRAQFEALLDEAHRRGMGIILRDNRTRWHGASTDPEGYRARYQAVMDDFGRHPAVVAIHIGDEPETDAKADAMAALRIAAEISGDKVPFLNHFPYYSEVEARVGAEHGYEAYLKDFNRQGRVQLMCYDCYSQMNPDDAGTQQYFTNLYIFNRAAQAAGIPLWTTLLSVGHFRYRVPSEDDIRWQLYTAIASGCTGLLWFTFYTPLLVNYRLAPIDEHGHRTPTYDSMSRVQKTFLKKEGTVMPYLRATRVAHINRSYGGFELFLRGDDDLLDRVTTTDNLPAIATWYTHEDGGRYFSLVNNSPRESVQLHIEFKGERALHRYDFGRVHDMMKNGSGGDSDYKVGQGKTTVDTWLAPGQMVLYRVE